MENAIVIPCYNEAKRLDISTFNNFLAQKNDYTICFVNDGSSDNTLEILKDFQQNHQGRVYVYDAPQNNGKAEAIRSGINYMLQYTKAKKIGFMDADLATSFDDYENLVDSFHDDSDNDGMVIGSRTRVKTANIQRTAFRSASSNMFNKAIQWIIGLKINDTQCGAKVFTRKTASTLFRNAFISRWLFDIELLMRMRNKYGKQSMIKKFKEVRLSKWTEVEGSKITLKDAIQFPIQLVRIALNYNFKPAVKQSPSKLLSQSYKLVKSFLF